MILVTGPTGSGKTTTLYGALDKINSPDKKIITIEDPVEYQLFGVNQIHVKPSIGLTFASGLRSIVRQDPDVIMVGEIRDAETAEIAIQAALTGHLVFSTLHTNDAAGAVSRLLEMGVENYLLASALLGVLAQRLVRRVCRRCAQPVELSVETLREIGGGGYEEVNAVEGHGCEECANTGYRGRSGVYELLPVTDTIKGLILERASSNLIKEAAVKQGMRPLREDGWRNVRKGVTTVAEVVRVSEEEVSPVGWLGRRRRGGGARAEERPGKVAVLGLDGVGLPLVTDLVARGVTPNLGRLIAAGTAAPMRSSIPTISSVSWTGFMTGKNPGKHGVYGFTDLKPGTLSMFFPNFGNVRGDTLWDVAGRDGKGCIVLHIPNNIPDRELNGVLVWGIVTVN